MFIRTQWSEMSGFPCGPDQAGGAHQEDERCAGGGCEGCATEKYTALELLGPVENMGRQDAQMRWCDTDAQLADGLTKLSAQDRVRTWCATTSSSALRRRRRRSRRFFVAKEKVKTVPGETLWVAAKMSLFRQQSLGDVRFSASMCEPFSVCLQSHNLAHLCYPFWFGGSL